MDVINVIRGLLHSATKTPMPPSIDMVTLLTYTFIHVTKEHETSKDIFHVS